MASHIRPNNLLPLRSKNPQPLSSFCVAAIMCVADTAPAIAKKARLVCEYGRRWQTGAGYDYQYGYQPPTKWEQKGFCPPGQAKKGNC